MRSKERPKNQLHFLAPTLEEQLNPKHELYLLCHSIDWDYFEKAFGNLHFRQRSPCSSDPFDGFSVDLKVHLQSLR